MKIELTMTMTPRLLEALASIAQMGGILGYVRVPAYLCRGAHARLRYWGLIEPEHRRSARWRVTNLGVRFLRGEAEVREVAVVRDDQVIRFERPARQAQGRRRSA